jgi:hypothetical protein
MSQGRGQAANGATEPGPAEQPAAGAKHAAPPPARRRGLALDPSLLRQLLCHKGYSIRRSALALGVCHTTARVAAGRLGIALAGRPSKIDSAVQQAVALALGRGEPLAELTDAIGISLPSVYRMLRMDPLLAAEYKAKLLQRKRMARRQLFLLQVADKPMSECAEYYWLRRNDAAWLRQWRADRR